MKVEEARDLFRYNAWANRKVFEGVASVPEAQYLRDLKSSHGGIHWTLAHIVWAEQLWLARWTGAPNPVVPQGKDLHTLAEVRARWEQVEAERSGWLAGFSDARLADTVRVKPTSGGEFVHRFDQMFRHLVNHSSYHRGQVVTLLRQLGSTPPTTDLIVYYREQARNSNP